MRNLDKPISTNKLMAAVWPSESSVTAGTVRTYMLSLRRKLVAAGQKGFIKTVLGSGYVIETSKSVSSKE